MQISFEKKEKIAWMHDRRLWGRYSVVSFLFAKKFLTESDWVCWSILVMDKAPLCSSFFGTIPSDRIHKSTNEVHVQKFSNSVNYISELQEHCEAARCNLYA